LATRFQRKDSEFVNQLGAKKETSKSQKEVHETVVLDLDDFFDFLDELGLFIGEKWICRQTILYRCLTGIDHAHCW
jgi:hypothetical protein